jgi:hypothetical protein
LINIWQVGNAIRAFVSPFQRSRSLMMRRNQGVALGWNVTAFQADG